MTAPHTSARRLGAVAVTVAASALLLSGCFLGDIEIPSPTGTLPSPTITLPSPTFTVPEPTRTIPQPTRTALLPTRSPEPTSARARPPSPHHDA